MHVVTCSEVQSETGCDALSDEGSLQFLQASCSRETQSDKMRSPDGVGGGKAMPWRHRCEHFAEELMRNHRGAEEHTAMILLI